MAPVAEHHDQDFSDDLCGQWRTVCDVGRRIEHHDLRATQVAQAFLPVWFSEVNLVNHTGKNACATRHRPSTENTCKTCISSPRPSGSGCRTEVHLHKLQKIFPIAGHG